MRTTVYSILLLMLSVTFSVHAAVSSELTIEIAKTDKEKIWGLMNRPSLPENHGMIFLYNPPQKVDFWMFNTLIDLSVAFIDDHEVIQEIHYLESFPEKMDPKRSVKDISDLDKYSFFDPIRRFFLDHRVFSERKCEYVLEVNSGWFERNNIHVGDKIRWQPDETILRFQRHLQ